MSAYVNLLGVIDAGKNQYHTEYLNERGRGYASSSVQMATEWARLAAMAEIGLG